MIRSSASALALVLLLSSSLRAGKSLEGRLDEVGRKLEVPGASLALPDLRGFLGELEDLRERVRSEWQRLYLRRLLGRVWERIERLGREQGSSELILESLGALAALDPDSIEGELRLCQALQQGGREQEERLRLETLWFRGQANLGDREKVGLALLRCYRRVPGPVAGKNARLVAEKLRDELTGLGRARVERELAELAFEERRFEDALGHFQAFLPVLPADPALRRKFEVLKSFVAARRAGRLTEAAPASFFTVEVGDDVPFLDAEQYRLWFEAARQDLGTRLDCFPEGNLLVRVLVDQEYVRLLSPHSLGVREDDGILLRRAPSLDPQELRATVFHEYAHHLLAEQAAPGRLPRWYHEGVAQYLEESPVGLGSYRRVLRASMAEGQPGSRGLPDQGELDRFAPADLPRARLLYDVAALWVEYLVGRFGEGVLAGIGKRVAAGRTFSQALEDATGGELRLWWTSWRDQLLDQVRARLRRERRVLAGEGEEDPPEEELEILVHADEKPEGAP